MINARELRIGNWIALGGNSLETYQTYKPHLVSVATIKAIAEENEERGNDYVLSVFQPIPITSDILEKCGFKRQPQQNKYGDSSFAIFLIDDKYYWARRTDKYGDIDEYYDPVEITSLHHLQNLYYSLTQKELQLNEAYENRNK